MTDKPVVDRSAQGEQDHRLMHREQGAHESHPSAAGLLLAITGEPQTTNAWSSGAAGEHNVGQSLDALADRGVIALHDRRIPGSSGNIDEIAIGPSGVFVIAVERYEGRAAKRDLFGSMFRNRHPGLLDGVCDRTKLVSKMAWQMAVVRNALEEMPGAHFVPGRAMLAFVGAQSSLFRSAFDIDGVWVGWPKDMAKVVSRPGPLDSEMIQRVAGILSYKLNTSR